MREVAREKARTFMEGFARRHQKRHGGSFEDAMAVAARLNPECAGVCQGKARIVIGPHTSTHEPTTVRQYGVEANAEPSFDSMRELVQWLERDYEQHQYGHRAAGDYPMSLDARGEVHAQVKKYQYEHKEPDYKTALDRVLKADPDLKERYAESAGWDVGWTRIRVFADVGEEVHAKVKKFQADHNEPDYKTALDRVLGADAVLRDRYAFGR